MLLQNAKIYKKIHDSKKDNFRKLQKKAEVVRQIWTNNIDEIKNFFQISLCKQKIFQLFWKIVLHFKFTVKLVVHQLTPS